jgi:hypothetical protein
MGSQRNSTILELSQRVAAQRMSGFTNLEVRAALSGVQSLHKSNAQGLGR